MPLTEITKEANDLRSRVDHLEFVVAEIKEALMGDLKNPGGGTLQIVSHMHADLTEIKKVLETLKLERAKLIGWISGAIAVGGLVGKFLLK